MTEVDWGFAALIVFLVVGLAALWPSRDKAHRDQADVICRQRNTSKDDIT